MEKTIQKAIEGGYKGEYLLVIDEYYGFCYKIEADSFLLNPLFWQCLGKSLNGKEGDLKIKNGFGDKISRQQNDRWWKETWHSFIDHLASGGNPEDFFNQLLN